MTPVEARAVDLTPLAVDAIVDATNGSLPGGGGVDGTVHRASGPRLLAECRTRCYRNAPGHAVGHGVRTVALPAISTGAYRFPLDRATANAVREVSAFLAREPSIEQVIFACFGDAAPAAYQRELAALKGD